MRSQLCFVMHEDDERAFVEEVLKEEGVALLVQSPGKGKKRVVTSSIDEVSDWISGIVHERERATDGNTIQFLRSRLLGETLTQGRISVSSDGAKVTARYRRLVRWLKKNCKNSQILWRTTASYAPEAMNRLQEPSRSLWVGKAAIAWLGSAEGRRVSQYAESEVTWGELRPDFVMLGPRLIPRSEWEEQVPMSDDS